jgi:hypothetical protein
MLLRTVFRGSVVLGTLVASWVAVVPAAADTLFPFTAVLNGAQETPPVASPSQGVAFLTLNKESKDLCYAISYSPLSSAELFAHFHVAPPGQPGPIIIFITPGPSPLGSPKNGCVALDSQQEKDLKKGLLYINIHSATFPAGEIRGQVLPTNGVRYPKVSTTTTTPTTSTTTTTITSPSGAFLD